ncbi:spore protease YyaC [Paenibacillus abyssi]|uniref:Spore protease YyaC n=1 Tax=Paenibacillus abyssi TaxID=1340531 RepID=A0A917FNH9_9BACL|nr:spore protease YyaC [Paenibacillus abyssi]GGF95705.1 hypothetical protein GCM10010916_11260 [Paenibacillus abyssi]
MKRLRVSTRDDEIRKRRTIVRAPAIQNTKRERADGAKLTLFLASIAERHPCKDDILFLCIGSDRSTGDAFGPLVGNLLQEQGWPHVTGTLKRPCDAQQLLTTLSSLPEDKVVIAIDACLGKPESVGAYLVARGPLIPAQALGTTMPEAGNYSIAGVVNVYGPKPYTTLQTTSLFTVMQMAKSLAEAIHTAWPQSNFESRG